LKRKSSAPSFNHQTILPTIGAAFLDYLRKHPIGHVAPGVGVIFDDYNAVVPDLVFATNELTSGLLPEFTLGVGSLFG
jgi:hypothetical protein